MSTLNSKHFINKLLNNKQLSAGQILQLHDFKSLVKAFFPNF